VIARFLAWLRAIRFADRDLQTERFAR